MKSYSKYHNRKIKIDNMTFDSIKEANRYKELKLLEKAGIIRNLSIQPEYELIPEFFINGKKINAIYYIADFCYYDVSKKENIIEDVKGYKTDVYKLKKKIFEYIYQIPIIEI